jgi:hypothetical protein
MPGKGEGMGSPADGDSWVGSRLSLVVRREPDILDLEALPRWGVAAVDVKRAIFMR